MEFLIRRRLGKDIVLILLGTFLMAVSVNLIYDPMGLVTGGVTGIGIIVRHLTGELFDGGIPVWLTNIIINIPLFVISWIVLGIKYIGKTMLATISLSAFLYLIPVVPVLEADFLLASLFGGVIGGIGMGLVFMTKTTTGGTDMIGMLLHHWKPYYSVPQMLLAIDAVVVILGAVVFGVNKALYAVIAVYMSAKVSDRLLDGLKFAKSAYIISDKYRDIADEIMNTIDRGVTSLTGTGMYSKEGKNVLFCVVSKKEMVEVLDIVYKLDPHAFVTISDVREVMGEGFIEYTQ